LPGWYGVVKAFFSVCAALLFAVASAQADEPDVETLLGLATKAVPYRDAWERCAAAAVKRELPSDLTAAALAERAVGRCRQREMRLQAALAKSIGADQAQSVVVQLRGLYRTNLTTIIEELRSRR
jgi:hypothetical protein